MSLRLLRLLGDNVIVQELPQFVAIRVAISGRPEQCGQQDDYDHCSRQNESWRPVKPRFEGKLPFIFNLPELHNSSFRLMGGKLTYFEQNPGAQLLFGVRQHQISVFIFQDRGGLAKLDSSTATKLAFAVETWAEGGLRYFVISDASPVDVHALSDMLKVAARSS